MSKALEQETIVEIIRIVTSEVFSTMMGQEAVAQEPHREVQAPGNCDGVLSFIGLAGAHAGTGSLSCNSELACKLASTFLMTEFDAVNEEVLDAFGELTNMIIGNLKNHLEEHLGPMGLSVPTVIHGRNFTARSLSHEEWIVVPFSWAGGSLDVKVCLKSSEEADASVRHGVKQEFLLGS